MTEHDERTSLYKSDGIIIHSINISLNEVIVTWQIALGTQDDFFSSL